MPREDTQSPMARRGRAVTALISSFADRLSEMTARAQAKTIAQLSQSLDLDKNGTVALTPRNQIVLRQVDSTLMDELKTDGYDALVGGFTATFKGQIPMFEEALQKVAAKSKKPLPAIRFTQDDIRAFDQARNSGSAMLKDAVARAAEAAKRNALLAVGGLSFRELADAIAKQWRRSVPEAERMAATAISTFYRTINQRAADKIESSGVTLKYVPHGPLDKLTRPFCRGLLESGKTYTRAEIDRMKNGQLPNCFVTFGGYNCRHVWLTDGIAGMEGEDE